jgi:spermidine/putrescine transport system substrate-binding protein
MRDELCGVGLWPARGATRREVLALALALTGCGADRRPRLNVFNWSSYIAPETVPDFEKEFGVRARYGLYESNEEMLAKVMTGNSGWDIVFPTHSRIQPMIRNGLLARLDHSRLRNLDNLDPQFRHPFWDPDLNFCVPYMWNGTGIVYNTSVAAPVSWADLWRSDVQGRVTMLDDAEDVIGACLLKMGFSFDSTDAAQLAVARAQAVAQKKSLRAYINAEVRDQLVSGDVLMAQLWSTTAESAIRGAEPGKLAFVYPREGFPVYCDNAAILRESRHADAAHEFLNYILLPKVNARIAIAAETATASSAARALLPPEIRGSRTLYPDAETMKRAVWPPPLPSAAQRYRDRIWTEIKSA